MKNGTARSGEVEVAYIVEGNGAETVILIMGLGGRATDWGASLPAALAERYRVVRMDNRGAGASPPASGGYSLSDLARDVTAVLDAVGAARAHVIGISMGGMIAQLVAIEHAARVDRLVLMSTHYGGHTVEPPHPDAMRLFDPAEFLSRGRDPEAMMRFTLSVIAAPGFEQRAPEMYRMMLDNARGQPTPANTFMAQVQAILTSDRSERVREIRRPTLVLHGALDKLIPPSNAKALAQRIPGARLALLEGVGHMPMLEAPAETVSAIMPFLAGA